MVTARVATVGKLRVAVKVHRPAYTPRKASASDALGCLLSALSKLRDLSGGSPARCKISRGMKRIDCRVRLNCSIYAGMVPLKSILSTTCKKLKFMIDIVNNRTWIYMYGDLGRQGHIIGKLMTSLMRGGVGVLHRLALRPHPPRHFCPPRSPSPPPPIPHLPPTCLSLPFDIYILHMNLLRKHSGTLQNCRTRSVSNIYIDRVHVHVTAVFGNMCSQD